MNDKVFGYIILAVLVASFAAISGYSIYVLVFPKETRIIAFNQVSNLRVDDPVKLKGTTVAVITDIIKGEKNVLVTIKVLKPLTINAGYQIYTSDKGILGDQQVILVNGNSANPVISPTDTLTGIFHPGVSDVLGSAWKLKEFAISFRQNANILLTGSSEKESFIQTFTGITIAIDTFSQKIYTLASTLNTDVTHAIDTLQTITTAAQKISHEMTTSLPKKLQDIDEAIGSIMNFVEKLDSLENSLTDIVLKIQNNTLIKDDRITPLINQLNDIHGLITEIRNGTARLKVRVHAGFE